MTDTQIFQHIAKFYFIVTDEGRNYPLRVNDLVLLTDLTLAPWKALLALPTRLT